MKKVSLKTILGLVVLATCTAVSVGQGHVWVYVDMNPAVPGYQPFIIIPPPMSIVSYHDVGFWIFSDGHAPLYTIGDPLSGLLAKGIAFGHMKPTTPNYGVCDYIEPGGSAPINPGNTGYVLDDRRVDKAFNGPEIQYLEWGTDRPVEIPMEPMDPVWKARIRLVAAGAGDIYDFYIADRVAIARPGRNGVFGAFRPFGLDSGGDSVRDFTATIYGIDVDVPVPVPPAAYKVDFRDGRDIGGPARIIVSDFGDANGDGQVNRADLEALLLAVTDPAAYAEKYPQCSRDLCDVNRDGQVDALDAEALLTQMSD